METQHLAGLSHTLQTIAAASLIFAACLYISKLNFQAQVAKLPALNYEGGKSTRAIFLQSAKKMYIEGYQQFKDRVYRMADIDGSDVVIVSPRFLPELGRLPDSVLSFPKAIDDTMEVKYTQVKTDEPISAHSIKADLTPALVRINPILTEEVQQAIEEDIGPCEDWTPVPIYMKLVSIVAKVSGRVFVGPELCRNKEYLDAGINYTMELIGAQRAIKAINPWLRPFLAPRLPQVKRLRQREQSAKDFLAPVVAARQEAEKDPDYQKPEDLLQFFMNNGDKFNVKTPARFGKVLLGIIFAAIHTTTLVTTNILYTLAVQPEYVEPLREEIRTALAESNGVINSRTLQKMEKLDSYMKEVMRFYPPGFSSMNRKVLKPFTLSNGQYIPAGVKIEVPSYAIYQDPSFYPDSEKFDGFRFAKLRKQGDATSHARNQFVTTNEQNVGFGYGRHACPGRFFAANEIKMILCRLILEYDFKNLGGSMERYPNQEVGRASNPDPTKLLLFRKAQV